LAGEDSGNEQFCPRNEPPTESGSLEKPEDSNCEPNVGDAVESAGAVDGTSEKNDAQGAKINPEMEIDRQPLISESTACSGAAEALSSAGSMQPISPEVLTKKKKQTVGGKKGFQKPHKKADSVSTAGTWEVTSSDDTSKKNIVFIRRQHTSGIPDTAFPVEEAASTRSEVSCEATSVTGDRNFSGETDDGNMIHEQVASVSVEPVEGPGNTEVIDTACIKTDVTVDISAKNVNSLPSTDGGDIAESLNVRPKRRGKMAANREACRKSQRCISRRRDADECVATAPVSSVAPEAKTAGVCDARTADEGNALCLVSMRVEASQEHVMSSHIAADISDETEPAASVSSSVINQTEVSVGSCDPSVMNSSSITAASVDSIVQPVASVASTEKSDLASESSSELHLSGLLNRVDARDSSEDQYPLNSTSHVNNSACRDDSQPTSPIVIKQELKVEPPWTNEESSVAIKTENIAVKRESDSTSCSYLAADSEASGLVSNDTSLLNTCLSRTFLESTVSPAEQLSNNLSLHSRAADRTDKEVENSGTPSAAALIKTEVSCDDESEEVCKTILDEVVAHVVKETCTMSASKEHVESSSTGSSAHVSGNVSAPNESDGLSGEIPLKKRRGRRVFTDRQPSNTVTSLPQSGEDRRDVISARSYGHRRKIAGSSSHRRLPRGKKYVGAHTSIIGKLVPKC